MKPLDPHYVFKQYKIKKIDKVTALENLCIIIENGEDDLLSVEALKYMGRVGLQTFERYQFLENLFLSHKNKEIKAISADLIAENFIRGEKKINPTYIFDKYQDKRIDRTSAIRYLQLLIENSSDEELRLDGLKFLERMNPQTDEIFNLLESLLLSDSNLDIRSLSAKLIVENFLEKGKKVIEYFFRNSNLVFIQKSILEALQNSNIECYKELRGILLEDYAKSYGIICEEAEFFIDLDFEVCKTYGDLKLYPNYKEFSCRYVHELKRHIEGGSEVFYSVRNFHITGVDLSSNGLRELPESIGALKKLRYLNLRNNGLTELPDSVPTLPRLKRLNLEWTELRSIPKWLYSFAKSNYTRDFLKEGVALSDAPILGIFQIMIGDCCLFKYDNIEEEVDGEAQGYEVDSSGHITGIYLNNVENVKITTLPEEIVNLKHLKHLFLHGLKKENLSLSVKKFLANLESFGAYRYISPDDQEHFGLNNLKRFKNIK